MVNVVFNDIRLCKVDKAFKKFAEHGHTLSLEWKSGCWKPGVYAKRLGDGRFRFAAQFSQEVMRAGSRSKGLWKRARLQLPVVISERKVSFRGIPGTVLLSETLTVCAAPGRALAGGRYPPGRSSQPGLRPLPPPLIRTWKQRKRGLATDLAPDDGMTGTNSKESLVKGNRQFTPAIKMAPKPSWLSLSASFTTHLQIAYFISSGRHQSSRSQYFSRIGAPLPRVVINDFCQGIPVLV